MREILEEELPGVTVSTSAEVLPEIFEHERFSTTVANAVLSPLISGYVSRLAGPARRAGIRWGRAAASFRRWRDDTQARAAFRGPPGRVGHRRRRDREPSPLVALRLRRTRSASTWVERRPTSRSSTQGEERVTKEWFVEYGYPICFPSIEVLTIGAGGGSFAWIDEAGSLRNGPQSAGAHPGPACYGRGNDRPTNTDANLVLGRLGASLIGGAMDARPGRRRAGAIAITSPTRSGSISSRPQTPSSAWPTRTWRTPCG